MSVIENLDCILLFLTGHKYSNLQSIFSDFSNPIYSKYQNQRITNVPWKSHNEQEQSHHNECLEADGQKIGHKQFDLHQYIKTGHDGNNVKMMKILGYNKQDLHCCSRMSTVTHTSS